jgi:UDP-N-acetylmuramoyl-L-alanyl-D-glutamate--2,6-diaminopimelate ligase
MKLKDVLAGVPLLGFKGNEAEDIQGIAYSSKNVQPGFMFTALKGMKADGLEFIEEALHNGAVAVLSDRAKPENFTQTWIQVSDIREALALCSANFYSHPSQKMKVIGITGTKGKTTITYILEEILKKSRLIPGVIGTISYRGPQMTIQAERTTPEAPDIQRILCKMFEHGVTHCIMEVSSHALDLKRILGIGFDVVVFVNLSGDHLDYHQTMEKYFEAKKRLFFLNQKKRMAVVNEDDPWGKKLLSQLSTGAMTYGIEPGAMVRGENFKLNEKGIEASVKYPEGQLSISSSLLGKPNLYNILASVAVALTLNIPLSAIKEGIASLKGVPGRFEKIENSLGFHIFVDYAHTDDALKNLLETVRGLKPKRIILVFGAGGDRDKTKRPRMGEAAGTLSDWTIITSDNPRSEEPMAIISDIEKGIKKTGTQNYEIIPDRKEAIAHALSIGEKGDYILVAGKGHEDYQILGDKTIHFDDAEVIREILQEKGKTEIG